MEIIIRRLPDATTKNDLVEFASSALKPKWYFFEFTPLGNITECDIYAVNDGNHNVIGHQGRIQVDSKVQVNVVVERLNSSLLKNKRVDAGLYNARARENDRRIKHAPHIITPSTNHRTEQRRSCQNAIEHLST